MGTSLEFLESNKKTHQQHKTQSLHSINHTIDDLSILNNVFCRCGDGSTVSSIKTYLELRSYTELKDDLTLDRPQVFDDYTDLVWVERKDVIKVLNGGRSRVEKKKNIVGHVKEIDGGC